MIVFDLICGEGHRFESWFASGAAYERQQAEGAVECPVCATRTVHKAPMAPRLTLGAGEPAADGAEAAQSPLPAAPSADAQRRLAQVERLAAALTELRQHLEANSVDVGRRFPEEARRIHYGEALRQDIHGDATVEEAQALREEGIEVLQVPLLRRRDD